MHDPFDDRSRLMRAVADPIRARRMSAVALLAAAPVAGAAHTAHWGFSTGMLAALCWAIAPFIAAGIGYGDAFFIQYGRGRRRVMLTLVAGLVLALSSCVILAGLPDEHRATRHFVTEGIGYGMLYFSSTTALASLIALTLGFGRDYVSERIMRMSRDDW